MMYAAEMNSDGSIHVLNSVKIGSDIKKKTLRLLSQQIGDVMLVLLN
jgi:hypothetical protein